MKNCIVSLRWTKRNVIVRLDARQIRILQIFLDQSIGTFTTPLELIYGNSNKNLRFYSFAYFLNFIQKK